MKKAIVLLSGGQDSTTCLFWAKKNFDEVVAIGFDYGQKHAAELAQAAQIARMANVQYVVFPAQGLLGGSSLTNHRLNHNEAHMQNNGLPASFTAGRNALFLTVAAAFGHKLGITDIVTGVCQTDYSGYPDCRRDFIDAMEESLGWGIYGKPFQSPGNDTSIRVPTVRIHTPLMYKTKAETWALANELGCLDIIIHYTLTDYNGDTTMNEWGMGKEDNPASKLRAEGYREAVSRGWI